MPGRATPSNASKLRLRFRPLRRHRLWQLLVGYLTPGKTGNRETALNGATDVVREALSYPT